MSRVFLPTTLLVLSLMLATHAFAEEELKVSEVGEAKEELPLLERMTFEDFFEKAKTHSVKMVESQGQLGVSEARLDLAKALAWPELSAQVLGGPSPEFSGNALNSTTDFGSWGVAMQSRVELIQPLYTFEALAKLRQAAEAAHEAEKGRHSREEWQLRESIAKMYFGYQLAFELRELSRDLIDQLEKAQEEGQKLRRKKARGAPSLTDLERLKVFHSELTARFDEAQKFMDLAKLGMAVEIGEYQKSRLRWRRASLKRSENEFQNLAFYRDLAKEKRPEYQALSKEVEARKLFWEASQRQQWPQIFAGARWDYGYSNVSEVQPSRYANDPMNQNTAMFGVGLRWNLFSPTQSAKVSQAKAEYIKVEGKNKILLNALDAELEKNWLELQFLIKSVGEREKAEQSARRVFLDMYSGFVLGTSPAKDLLEALGLWAQMKKSRLEAVYEERLAWARLEASAGTKLAAE